MAKNADIKTNRSSLTNYIQESIQELRKVTWPTRTQAIKLTFIVLGFCLATAIVIGVFDFIFNFGYYQLLQLSH